MGCEIVKRAAEEHGVIRPEYIDYARQDVASTHDLSERCRIELERHPIGMPAHRVFSSAGIGKGYRRAALQPCLHRRPPRLGHAPAPPLCRGDLAHRNKRDPGRIAVHVKVPPRW
jgi:hypothetical protein